MNRYNRQPTNSETSWRGNSSAEHAFSRWRNVCDLLVVLSYLWCFGTRVMPSIYAMIATSPSMGQATSFPALSESTRPNLKVTPFACTPTNALGYSFPANQSSCSVNGTVTEPEPSLDSIVARMLIADCTFCRCPDNWAGWDCSKRWFEPHLLQTLHKHPQTAMNWFNQHWWWVTPYFALRYSLLANFTTMMFLVTILFLPIIVPGWWAEGGRTLVLMGLRVWTPTAAILQGKYLAQFEQPNLVTKLSPMGFVSQGLMFLGLAFPIPWRHHLPIVAIEGALLVLHATLNFTSPAPSLSCPSVSQPSPFLAAIAGLLLGAMGSIFSNALETEVVVRLRPSLVSSAGPYSVKQAATTFIQNTWWLLQTVVGLLLSAEGFSSLLMFVGYMVVSNCYDTPADMPLWLRALIL